MSSNYWEKRAARQMHNQMQMAEDYAKDLAKYYIAASRHLQSEQNTILRRFALTHHMTIKEAEELISSLKDPSSIKELIKALKKDPKNAELVKEFEAQAARSRIMRLNALQSQVTYTAGQIQVLLNKKAQKLFVNLARSAYYNTMFDAMQRAGYGFNVKMLDPKRIKRVMDRSWTGAGFSKRLWSNTKALEDAVKREIMVNLLTGRPLIKASQAINEEFGKGYNNARRLIRTESAYITNQMTLEGYKDLEADKYIYVAILDLKTSEICRGLDKKRFLVKSAKVGVNYPPMHPWCRSTTIPWMPDSLLKNIKQRALDPKTGKHVLVPGDMTYEQWYKQFVEGKDVESKDIENKSNADNRNLTKAQYERYKERFWDDFPYTYDEFIKLKRNKDEWNKWKKKYKETKRLNTTNGTYSASTTNVSTTTYANNPSTLTSSTNTFLSGHESIINEWKPERLSDPNVTDAAVYVRDGIKYYPDGNNVQFTYDKHEKEVGELISSIKGVEVNMLPRVNNPVGVPSADYLIDGETFCDLKTLTKEAKEKAIYNRVMHSVDQADTFIIDATNYDYGEEVIDKQIDTIFWSRHTRTVNEIIVIRNMSVIRAERRKK